MAKKAKPDFKKLFAEKGEKIGFYAAAGLLAVFLIMGGYVASKAASPSGIARDMEAKVAAVQQKTVSGPADPAPIDQVVYKGAKVPVIPFTEHVTPNSFFNIASDAHMKRDKPKILAVAEGKAQFIRGSIATLDIIEDTDEGTVIGVLATKAAVQNDARRINQILIRNRQRQLRPGAAAGVPPAPAPGGRPGGGGLAAGPRGGGGDAAAGGGGAPNTRSNENEVQYMKITDKRVETAKLVENILPKRMVVVTGAIPYKRQLEAYAAALRARTPQELAAGDLPLYRGFSVQRQVWSADGKNLLSDWSDLDLRDSLAPLFGRVLDLEPENFDGDPSLAQYFPRLIPDPSTQLLVPRPKLKRGEYEPMNLPLVDAALKALKELGGNAGQLKNKIQEKLDDTNIFNPGGLKNTGSVIQGSGGAAGTSTDGIQAGPGGRPGRGGVTPGGAPQQGAGPDVPEEAWLMRFIDITVEPGFAYRYRIELKVANPNYRRNVKELTMPKFAEEEDLRSPWFELPDTVIVPRDEFLYAAAKDERGRRVTEKLVQPESPDVTFLQIQRWADFVRPNGLTRAEPIGDWLVADIKAHRGQYIGEAPKVRLPLWSLVAGSFLFRDPPVARTAVSMFAPRPRADGQWVVDFSPQPAMLLVDFEGGTGMYTANKKQVIDQAEVDMLMIGDNGKVTVRRSQLDLADAERQKREDSWKKWLDQVAADTDKWRNANPPTGPGQGGPAGAAMPGGGAGANPGG